VGGSSAQGNSTESANNTATTPAPQQPGYLVIESKSSGRESVVGRYDDYVTARSVVKLLEWAGGTARIEPAL
jgi:hypothetical protein